jgi:hypothetical protein
MRLCHFRALSVPSWADNGIEKVRGSTPLISTIHVRVLLQGFPRVLVCAAIRPE